VEEILIAPSVLSANFSRMNEMIDKIISSKADWVHFDIMDGSFVPQITFGHKMVSDLRPLTDLTFDVHLMVKHPETFISDFAASGSDIITIHAEATVHLHRVLIYIKNKGKKCGISIVPSTPVNQIRELLSILDLVLVMTVNPGFGGQEMIRSCLHKVEELKEIKKEMGYSYLIEVDGGINEKTCKDVVRAGSEVLVTGSSFLKAPDPAEYIRFLKGCNHV
jgi:ribulose-phosphate 3-epimerase